MNTPTNPGDGYQFVPIGQHVQPDDEVYQCGGYWCRLGYTSSHPVSDPTTLLDWPFGWYRRKLPTPPTHPGYGYRWLKPGEKLQAGDTVWAGHAGVLNATTGDYIPVLGIGNTIGDPPPLFYRRALVVPTGWELAGEVPPDKEPEKGWKYWQPSADRWSESEGPTGCNRNSMQYTYIRPIEPTCEEGYRWLKEGETLQNGDEFNWGNQHKPDWKATNSPSYRVTAYHAKHHEYRRPLTPPEEKACRKAFDDHENSEAFRDIDDYRAGWLAGLAHAGFTGPIGKPADHEDWKDWNG